MKQPYFHTSLALLGALEKMMMVMMHATSRLGESVSLAPDGYNDCSPCSCSQMAEGQGCILDMNFVPINVQPVRRNVGGIAGFREREREDPAAGLCVSISVHVSHTAGTHAPYVRVPSLMSTLACSLRRSPVVAHGARGDHLAPGTGSSDREIPWTIPWPWA